jgi:hypothetical protein
MAGQPSEQGTPVDGLDEVVDGAERQPDVGVVENADDDDRYVAQLVIVFEFGEDLPAVDAGQFDVQQDDFGVTFPGCGESLLPGRGDADLVAGFVR